MARIKPSIALRFSLICLASCVLAGCLRVVRVGAGVDDHVASPDDHVRLERELRRDESIRRIHLHRVRR
jgi:hypothetical protein